MAYESEISRIALGVVTYNNPAEHLSLLSHSISKAAQSLPANQYRVDLVSIDCGKPGEWPVIDSVTHTILPSAGNLGFGGGMNRLLAAAFAHPKVIAFVCINPDGLLHPRLLVELAANSKAGPPALIEARQFPEEHPKPYDACDGNTLWASGACVWIPRVIYEKVGGFDPNLFMYMEDVDFSWRVRSSQFGIRVAPGALFSHSVLDRKPDLLIEKYYYHSARYMAYKWGFPEHQQQFEQIICDRQYDGGVLPTLPELPDEWQLTPDTRTIATFDHGFAYSPLRWC